MIRIKSLIVISFIVGCTNSYAEELSLLNLTFEATKEGICSNDEFLNCLGMAKAQCYDLHDCAFNKCPPLYMKATDEHVFNARCASEYIIENSGISPDLFDSCSKRFLSKPQK